MRLKGKRAIVTGGASGIGRAIVRRFVEEGATVLVADRNLAEAERLRDDLIARHSAGKIAAIGTDIADPSSVATMVDRSTALIGEPNVLVNNAGVNVFGDPLSTTDEAWDQCLSIDLNGAWHCCRAILPMMLRQSKGAIINMASSHASQAMRDTFPYPVAKHAMLGLTRALAVQYAGQGIVVNAISPGFINTPINDAYFGTFSDPAAARQTAEANQLLGRLGTPDEVAAVAVLLASDEARFICGANIVIDGGASIIMR